MPIIRGRVIKHPARKAGTRGKQNAYKQAGSRLYVQPQNALQTIGMRKSRTYESNTLALVPNAGNLTYICLTTLGDGTASDERISNTVISKGIYGIFNMVNTAATARYVRFLIVSPRGSINAHDVVTWNDLLVSAGYVKTNPVGTNLDITRRVNKDEYICYYDKTVKVFGTADALPDTKKFKLSKKYNIPAKYVYSSQVAREGGLYLVWFASEDAHTAAGASAVNVSYSFTTYHQDAQQA